MTATVGERVIDDTALSYEDRLLLSGRSREYVDKLRLQKDRGPSAAQAANREPVKTRGSDLHPAERTSAHVKTVSNKGS